MPMSAVFVVVLSFGLGAIPFSNLLARRLRRVDLRRVGTGTVSGTALYRIAGFGPLVVAGLSDIAKGTVGPLLAGPDRPALSAIAGGAAVCGHNWSPFLRGAGGRGVSPAMGALLVRHWPGAVLLLGALAGGRLVRQTGLGVFAADLALVPLLAATAGWTGALAGAAVVVPMLAKRALGNEPRVRRPAGEYLRRVLFDHDAEDTIA